MKKFDLIRALKDKNYRSTLSDAQRSALGNGPSGVADIENELLDSIAGGGTASNNGCGSGYAGGSSTFCLVCQR